MADHILWVALGGDSWSPRKVTEAGGAAGGHGDCPGVRLGLQGLKVSVNWRRGKVQPQDSAYSCMISHPLALLIIKVNIH